MSFSNAAIIPAINNTFGLTLPGSISLDELKQRLTIHINYLINHDFEKLVYYLYRIDVNEEKLKSLLNEKRGENAALLITELIIERQLQKIESRQQDKPGESVPDDEKW